jgi:hypothetical protein
MNPVAGREPEDESMNPVAEREQEDESMNPVAGQAVKMGVDKTCLSLRAPRRVGTTRVTL